jgi:hypothetical protein
MNNVQYTHMAQNNFAYSSPCQMAMVTNLQQQKNSNFGPKNP